MEYAFLLQNGYQAFAVMDMSFFSSSSEGPVT